MCGLLFLHLTIWDEVISYTTLKLTQLCVDVCAAAELLHLHGADRITGTTLMYFGSDDILLHESTLFQVGLKTEHDLRKSDIK